MWSRPRGRGAKRLGTLKKILQEGEDPSQIPPALVYRDLSEGNKREGNHLLRAFRGSLLRVDLRNHRTSLGNPAKSLSVASQDKIRDEASYMQPAGPGGRNILTSKPIACNFFRFAAPFALQPGAGGPCGGLALALPFAGASP